MDDIYQVYVNRVARMTLPEAYKSQVQNIQASPKFQRQSAEQFQAVPFPGYTVITPPWIDETENQDFYKQLQFFQEQITKALSPHYFVPLPPDSFHMTLADLIWASAFRHADEKPEFQTQLRDRIADIFRQCQPQVKTDQPLSWEVMGVLLMPRALGVCLMPKDESSYDRTLKLRRAIYQDSSLMALGIEQQYHLTAHITLGYFGDVPSDEERDALGDTLNQLNQQWLFTDIPRTLVVHRAELRKFDDMTRYYREADWPTLEFRP